MPRKRVVLLAGLLALLFFVGVALPAAIRGDMAFGSQPPCKPHSCPTTTQPTTCNFVTSIASGSTYTLGNWTWGFDPGCNQSVVAGQFWADGTQLNTITGPPSYNWNVPCGALGAGTHTLGHSWDLADGTHMSPVSSYPNITIADCPAPPPPPPSGQVLYGMNFDDGQRIPTGWSEGSNGTIALDSSTYWSSPNSDKFTLPQGSDRAELYSAPGNDVIHNHSDYYYKSTYMFPVGWTVDHMNLDQINMMSINSSCVAIEAGQSIAGVMGAPYTFALVNTGDFNNWPDQTGTYYSGDPQWTNGGKRPGGMPGPLYIQNPGEIVLGRWYQTITHVYWSTDSNGVVEVWLREKTALGATPSAWVKKVDFGPVDSSHATQFNAPTLQVGHQGEVGGTITLANIEGYSSGIADIVGGYIGVGQTTPTFSWYRDDWAKATTFEAAEAY